MHRTLIESRAENDSETQGSGTLLSSVENKLWNTKHGFLGNPSNQMVDGVCDSSKNISQISDLGAYASAVTLLSRAQAFLYYVSNVPLLFAFLSLPSPWHCY